MRATKSRKGSRGNIGPLHTSAAAVFPPLPSLLYCIFTLPRARPSDPDSHRLKPQRDLTLPRSSPDTMTLLPAIDQTKVWISPDAHT